MAIEKTRDRFFWNEQEHMLIDSNKLIHSIRRGLRIFLMALLSLGCFGALTVWIKWLGFGITYQPTQSMPQGLYLIVPAKSLKRNDIVIFRAPASFQTFLFQHHWIPTSGLLMKYVVGIPGDHVCNARGIMTINHQPRGSLSRFYAPNQRLPKKIFCQYLTKDEYLLMNPDVKRSFDGRYFGPVEKKNIVGQCRRVKIKRTED